MTSWTTDPEPPVRQVGPGWTTDPTSPERTEESPWFVRLVRVAVLGGDGNLSASVEPFIQGQALLRGDGALASEMAGRHWRDGSVVSNGVLVGEVWHVTTVGAQFTGDGLLELGINDGLSAVMCPGYGGKLEGRGDLTFVITGGNRIYPDGLSADVSEVTGLEFRDVALGGIGYFEVIAAPKTFRGVLLAGAGALTSEATASYPQDAQLAGDGSLTATMVSAFEPITEENTARTNFAVPGPGLTGVYVTLIGGGGQGGDGHLAASGNRAGGGGGGGGAKIDRFYIDATSLPSGVYSVTVGLAGTTGGGGFSRFVCGTISLQAAGGTAGGNGTTAAGTAGGGGTATQNGISGATLRTGGAGTAGSVTSAATDAADSATDRPGGGGGGGGYSSVPTIYAGGDGGSSATASGGVGSAGGSATAGGFGGDALPGFAGGGAGGTGGRASTPTTPNPGGNYGGGGGGGGGTAGGTKCAGGHGGPGYTKIEWV